MWVARSNSFGRVAQSLRATAKLCVSTPSGYPTDRLCVNAGVQGPWLFRPLGRPLRRPSRSASHFLKEARDSWDGLPARSPDTLTSSSTSGQWMPFPLPIKRQFPRSRSLACNKRGYHARGAERVRPSRSLTVNVSLDTVTSSAKAFCISAAEELVPGIDQLSFMSGHQILYPLDLVRGKSPTNF